MKYEELLSIFEKTENCDETVFYFKSDPKETEHYIGFLPEYEKPYWVGLCDIKDGCEFKTSKEMLEAPIYDGKSIKERWNEIIVCAINGCSVEDWLIYNNSKLIEEDDKPCTHRC
jgi:hypothetical protein